MKNNTELENLLIQWFEDNKNEIINKPHFWNRNKIANLIRKHLVAIGKWKNKRRGNPERGWDKMKEKEENKRAKDLLDF